MSICAELRRGIVTSSAEETRTAAEAFAAALPPDATVALHGDLGAGKTTFVQGLARGLGVAAPVVSPTFAIFTPHRGRERTLVHLDAYRLETAEQGDALLLGDFLTPPYCLAVEWPEKIPAWIPPDAWHVDLAIAPDGGHSLRLR